MRGRGTGALDRAIALAVVVGSACSSSGADEVAVKAFEVRECKTDHSSGTLLTGRESSDYNGLRCVAWDLGDPERPLIDLVNWPEGCGFQGSEAHTLWTPSAEQPAAGELKLSVSWNFGSPNACGGCFHDFSVALGPLMAAGRDLKLQVATRGCTGKGCGWSEQALELPIEATPAGITCRYLDWSSGWELLHFTAGKPFLPPDAGACDSGLVPSPVADGQTLCLAACATDADCPLTEIVSCRAGVCELAHPW
jgi:hypothetical protein